ncbi:MAG: SH3 domain-containing protein [Anaerolineae bacterium]|nr:SH3 domain-containing protein [Anaerolineae bacterium]MDK1117915.1 SH3 domain-containing protein [Anaerolineae bacterium]
MKNKWVFSSLLILIISTLMAILLSSWTRAVVWAQEPTPNSTGVTVTVIYTEEINIRDGPSTVLYEVIGKMQPGETAAALGASPGRDWIQIVFPTGPGGVAWVHTSLIEISAGTLRVIEPPPTATPRVTATIDPTLAAAYVFEPTAVRKPTFTPPPPLDVPIFTEVPKENNIEQIPMGMFVVVLGITGFLGYYLSTFRGRKK